MSETTTPTAAEVMGWPTPTPELLQWLSEYGWQIAEIPPPSPDDMLAWLRERNLTSFHFGVEGDGYYVDWGHDAAHAPTLHAALEAAVIAVGRT